MMVTSATAAAATAATTLLALRKLSAKVLVENWAVTYHCVDLLLDGSLGSGDAIPRADKSNLTLDLAGPRRLGDIDLAASRVLHLSNRFATLSDNHAYCLGRDVNGIVDLAVMSATAGAAAIRIALVILPTRGALLRGKWLTIAPAVAVHDLHDEVLRASRRLARADKIDGTKAIHTLVLRGNVNMATGPLLEVANGLATASNDEANGPVRHHDLHAILALLHHARSTLVVECATTVDDTHAAILDDAVDCRLDLLTSRSGARNLARTVGAIVGRWHELNSAAALSLDAAKVLALATDDKADEAGLNLDRLRVIVTSVASKRRPIAIVVAVAGREGAASAVGRVRTLAVAVVAAVAAILATLIAVRVDLVAIGIAVRGGRARARLLVAPRVLATRRLLCIDDGAIVGAQAILGSESLGLGDSILEASRTNSA